MNRKQRISIIVGVMLLALTGLYPPREYWFYGLREFTGYGFLFTMQDKASMHWPILLNEWLIIAAVTFGLFLIFREPKGTTDESRKDSMLLKPKQRRLMPWLTVILAVLVLSLGLTTYAAVRRVKRLEAGIQNVEAVIDSYLSKPEFIGPLPPGQAEKPQPKPPWEGKLSKDAIPRPQAGAPSQGGTPPWEGKLPKGAIPVVGAEYWRVVRPMQQELSNKIELLMRIREDLGKLD